jgi:hypothetical protein
MRTRAMSLCQPAADLGIRHMNCNSFSELQRLLEAPTSASADDVPDANE